MSAYESLPIKVTVVVEVDGHRLNFEQGATAKGARYHGARPQFDAAWADILEGNIRGSADSAIARAYKRAMDFLRQAYPVYTDREDTK